MDVRLELGVLAIMVALNGGFLEGSVHPLDLAVGPGMVGLGQPVLDVICITKHVEHVDAPPSRGPEPVRRQVCELDAIVGEHGVDLVGDSFDQSFQEVGSCPAIGLRMQLGVGPLRCPVDRHEQIELALLSSYLSNIEMEVADRIGLELPFGGFVAPRFRQATDPMALEAPMQGRSREVRNGRQSSSGSRVCLRKATMSASSSLLRTVDR